MINKFQKIIKDICDRNNIEFDLLSKDWVIMLKKGNKTRFISGYKFSLNDHALGEIFDDKYALFDLMNKLKIPVAVHNILYDDLNKNDYAYSYNDRNIVYKYLKNNNCIVIKSNKGTCGTEVYRATSIKEINTILNELFKTNKAISYCPYYDIDNEYRIIVLNKEIKLAYKKIKPVVVGDGKSTIRDLLIKFNKHFFNDILGDKKYDKVLKKGQIYEYDWKFNLSRGATIDFNIDNKTMKEISKITNKILDKIDIKFASIDIIKVDDKFMVLEINSGVMMKNLMELIDDKSIIEKIYEEAILLGFNNE